jgi:hypothetical protein
MQGDIDFSAPQARSRRDDPTTSHEAAIRIEKSGAAADQRALCLAQIKRNPGMTAAEVAVAQRMERHAPSRRLPELRDAGLVFNGHPRLCTVQGSRSLTWFPTDKEA